MDKTPRLKLSAKGLKFIAKWEGFRAALYYDIAGLPTIGYGHLIPWNQFDAWHHRILTEPTARKLLAIDVGTAESAVHRLVNVALTQNQFDALVSFVFNLGSGAFQRSTLLRRINQKEFKEAAEEFQRWNKASGRVSSGLTMRRAQEKLVFLTPLSLEESIEARKGPKDESRPHRPQRTLSLSNPRRT